MLTKKKIMGLIAGTSVIAAVITGLGLTVYANNEDKIETVTEYTVKSEEPAKKVNYEDSQKDLGFLSPKYLPAGLTLSAVILNEAPDSATTDKALKEKLKTYDVLYTNPQNQHESIYMIITKGGMGIGGPIEETTINGKKAELQENEDLINLSWKYKGITYWLMAHKSESLTRDEVLKFANSIKE